MDLADLHAIAEAERSATQGDADPLLHCGGLPLVRVDEGQGGPGRGRRAGWAGPPGPG